MAKRNSREIKIPRKSVKDSASENTSEGTAPKAATRSLSHHKTEKRPSVKASKKVIDPSGSIGVIAEGTKNSGESNDLSRTSTETSAAETNAASGAFDVVSAADAPEGNSVGSSVATDTASTSPASTPPPASLTASSNLTSDALDTPALEEDLSEQASKDTQISGELPTITQEELDRQAQRQDERISHAERERKRKRRRKIFKWVSIALLLLIIAAIVAICIAFALFRWHTFDDVSDIRGTWLVDGSDTPVVIDDGTIRLTDDVAYKYVIDPDSKTIQFTFGNMTGSARYRFSLDRSQLMIEDGAFDWWGSLFDDAEWTAKAFVYNLQTGEELAPSDAQAGGMLMHRDPASVPQTPAEQSPESSSEGAANNSAS